MTQEEALQKANDRWGDGKVAVFYEVGFEDDHGYFNVEGMGYSWEEAFADADKHAEGGAE